MKVFDVSAGTSVSQPRAPRAIERRILRYLKKGLAAARGSLALTLPSGHCTVIGSGEPQAQLRLNSYRALVALFFGGANGFSRSYLRGHWESKDLVALIKWGLVCERELEHLSKASALGDSLFNWYHRRRDNTRAGSRRNIAAHYDLGNAFYRLWLDPSMTYSAALFSEQNQSLEDAQYTKNSRILELLQCARGQQIIEIGCGWGGFAKQAAEQGQLAVRGITLSKEQLAWARETIDAADLADRVSLTLTDYRDITARYDGIVSIEMFEAVGQNHWDSYFSTLKRSLKPGGRAVLQVITIEEERFVSYRKQADFIQRYVFPGGMLISPNTLAELVQRHGFKLVEQQFFGLDYARTLACWSEQFECHWPQIAAQGFDDYFCRLWRYYLAYCQGGFEQGAIDVGLFVLEHSDS